MTNSKLIAALVVAALAVTPALAAEGVTAGNRGSGEAPVNRAAPLVPPAGLAARPLPHVDAAAASRDLFDMDPAAALAGFATLTLAADGSVDETPASDAMRAIFAERMEGNAG